jgi:hypothetical protein
MKQKRQRGKKPVKAQTITKAVTHIRLIEANAGKLAALDALAPVYLSLCQEYVTFFCTQEQPDPYRDTIFVPPSLNAGIGWLFNKRQVSRNHGEPIESRRIRTM